MTLPPAFFDELLDKVSLSSLIGRKVKLTRRGHEHIGLCPFHHEKTPSFTINDDKGFYHCFGCGAHGNAISYLVESEKMPFMEAVEYLANMAGVKMPKSSPDEIRFEQQRKDLTSLMEEACVFYQKHLFGLAGEKGKNYLIKRGISGTVAKQFRLGYAPSGSQLTQHFEAKGFDLKQAMNLGLIAKNATTGRYHDYFYDRIMFPILDRRKRVIGFGGRLLTPGEPKYLNSPETALFHKGEQLYALPHAIDSMRKKNRAILVEGYMDVIALHSSGFTDAVAPLGTAFTENQIRLLWQSCDEPLICFDGDGAGQKAAVRAMYRALPILVPGKSLRFVQLPDPYDPDDMIRKKSPEAFSKVLSEAISFADMLWQNLINIHTLDTPEKMALFEKDMTETVGKIQNVNVRTYYQNDFKNRLWKLTHSKGQKKSPMASQTAPLHTPTPGLKDAKMLLACMLLYPEMAGPMIDDIAQVHLPDQILSEILEKITTLLLENDGITADNLFAELGNELTGALSGEIEMIKKANHTPTEIEGILKQTLRESKRHLLQAEIDQKTEQYFQNPTPEVWENIKNLKQEIVKLQESE